MVIVITYDEFGGFWDHVAPPEGADAEPLPLTLGRDIGTALLLSFAVLLAALPILAHLHPTPAWLLSDAFYRSGALVFGGGHVILPLLHAQIAAHGWMPDATFLAGYSAAQAVPGPLFTFAAFLGAATNMSISPALGAVAGALFA